MIRRPNQSRTIIMLVSPAFVFVLVFFVLPLIFLLSQSVRRAKVGCLVATDFNICLEEQPALVEKQALYMQGEKITIRTALRALLLLEAKS